MRFAGFLFRSFGMAMAAAVMASVPHAFAADESDPDRDEVVVTHHRLGPLSEWAQMKAHNAEYQRLKAKFQPSESAAPAAAAAADRNAALPPSQREPEFFSEVRDSPTPPVVKALEDTLVPP